MSLRVAVLGAVLLLGVTACTGGPAPRPSPSSNPSPGPRPSPAACTSAAGGAEAPPAGYHVVAGVAAIPGDRVLQAGPSGESGPAVRLFAKWGLLVRTGETVEVSVGDGWAGRAAVGWGAPGVPAASVRVTACPTGSPAPTWTAFAGGTWVPEPACVPLTLRAGGRSERARLPIGRPCD